MTYNQLKSTLTTLLQSHAMIKQVQFNPPTEWLFKDSNPEYPICCFVCNTGSFERGYLNYVVSIWFLDKAGQEMLYADEVVSDQLQIANDIVSKLRQSHLNDYIIDDNISFTIVADSFEDYLAGVRMDVTIKTINKYEACSFPVNA